MNKKGFALLFGLMLASVIILLALAASPVLQEVVEEQLNDPVLNCSTTTDGQTQAVCKSIDMQQLWILILIGIAGIIVYRSI